MTKWRKRMYKKCAKSVFFTQYCVFITQMALFCQSNLVQWQILTD